MDRQSVRGHPGEQPALGHIDDPMLVPAVVDVVPLGEVVGGIGGRFTGFQDRLYFFEPHFADLLIERQTASIEQRNIPTPEGNLSDLYGHWNSSLSPPSPG